MDPGVSDHWRAAPISVLWTLIWDSAAFFWSILIVIYLFKPFSIFGFVDFGGSGFIWDCGFRQLACCQNRNLELTMSKRVIGWASALIHDTCGWQKPEIQSGASRTFFKGPSWLDPTFFEIRVILRNGQLFRRISQIVELLWLFWTFWSW